jgi:hypothetical protein
MQVFQCPRRQRLYVCMGYVYGAAIWSEISSCFTGTLNGESPALNGDGFSIKYKRAPVPHKLIMPNRIRTIRWAHAHDSTHHLSDGSRHFKLRQIAHYGARLEEPRLDVR